MRNDNSSLSWKKLKQEGRNLYSNENYEEALEKYRSSLTLNPPHNERQVLLSNVVACRLKIGGKVQYDAALVEAKQCVSLNENWSKAHVRLASVYIALRRSNDACNYLQTAIRKDPGNQTARTMLTNELRRERYERPSFNNNTGASTETREGSRATYGLDVTDELPFIDRIRLMIQSYFDKLRNWNASLGDDIRSLLCVALALTALYVLFGGRFGLQGNHISRGNYNRGNVYDRYHNARTDQTGSNTNYQRKTMYNDYNMQDTHLNRGGSSSFHFPNLFDGSLPSLISLFFILYAAHKYGGVNPFQALWMLNVLNPRRRGYGGGYGFGRGFGGGLGRGFGGGLGRGFGGGGFGRGFRRY